MGAVRKMAPAAAIACALTLATATFAGAEPLDGTDGTDGAGSASPSQGIDLNHPVSGSQLLYVTDYLMFRTSMSDFQHIRRQRLLPGQLSWSTSACDKGVKDPVYDFKPACQRREFGYHNYQRQNRFSDSIQDRVDDKFKDELRDECSDKNVLTKTVCERQADVYFETVKQFD